MYKYFILKYLRQISYVTFLFIFVSASAQDIPKTKAEKIKLVKKYAADLGANSYKVRKAAIKGLISLGYFSRTEVKNLLNSADPEIKENAKLVWDKIKWAVTENNPEIVNEFIKKFNESKAQLDDWVSLVGKCGPESIDVLIELKNHKVDIPEAPEDPLDDPFDDPFADADPFAEPRIFDLTTMLPVVIYNSEASELNETIKDYTDKKKDILKELLDTAFPKSSPYIQSRIINLSADLYSAEHSWSFFTKADISSNYIRSKASAKLIDYTLKNLKTFDAENKIKAYLLLFSQNKIDLQKIEKDLPVQAFHKCKNITQKVFYDVIGSKMSLENIQKLLADGNEAWHKYKLMSLKKAPDAETLTKAFKSVFEKGGDIVEFVEENFPADSIQAIPFYKIASQMENQEDDWFLYSTSANLLRHCQRTGDFEGAIKYLRMFNDENRRQKDSNETFYTEQSKLVKKETQKILREVQKLHDKPKEALKRLIEAEKLNPKILTVKIQKLEAMTALKQYKEAKDLLKTLVKEIPQNLMEIRELVYLSWELDEKEQAASLISKMTLGEEDYSNVTLASSSFEFFLQMKEMLVQQDTMQLNTFGKARIDYYNQKFETVPGLCESPEEGDFQFIWGVSAVARNKNSKEAQVYFSRRIFDEPWPEMLALACAGKISPQEIINEAGSVLSLVERKGRLTEAYYYAGCIFMAQGNKEKAVEMFQKAKDLKFYEYYEYVSAAVMLKKLK